MVTGVIYAKKRNIPKIPFQGLKHVGKTFVRAIWALLMPIIIIGGILGGFFTASRSSVIATLYGIAYGLIARRLKVREISDSLRDGIIAAVGPISLIAISSIFSYMLAREGVTGAIATSSRTTYTRSSASSPSSPSSASSQAALLTAPRPCCCSRPFSCPSYRP